MKNTILILAMCIISVYSQATEWFIDAGGGPDLGTPYFDPQDVSIMQNDVVTWNWVTGVHNVAATAGPESFNSGSHTAPYSWSFTFTLPGTYDFVCSLFEHELTQFGTIVVTALPIAVANLESPSNGFSIWPNPAIDSFLIEKDASPADISITDLNGRTLLVEKNIADLRRQYDISGFPCGIYFVQVFSNGILTRKRLVIN